MPNFYDLNDDGQLNGSDKDNPKNQQGGAFVVYWSVSAKYDGENSQPGKKVTHVLWAATKDFTNETYMFGGVFVPNSKYNRGNTIDTTMLQNSSRTYRTTGSGVIFAAANMRESSSNVSTASTGLFSASSFLERQGPMKTVFSSGSSSFSILQCACIGDKTCARYGRASG